MIHETLMKLRETDDHIRGVKRLISDLQGIRGGGLRATPSSGFGRPTESRAIKLVDLEEALTSAELDRMCLCQRLEEEKAGCPDELVWKLLWDHFYLGYPWKRTGLRHGMKESATKMRALRFLKKIGADASGGTKADMTLGEPPE